MRKRYRFISNMASPYQVKFAESLNEYYDCMFYFYKKLDDGRPKWWIIPLNQHNKILKDSFYFPFIGVISFHSLLVVMFTKIDILVLGGFSRWHLILSKIAKLRRIKVGIMSEPLRNVENDNNKSSKLLNQIENAKSVYRIRKWFKKIDFYIAMGDIAEGQFYNEFGFNKQKIVNLIYPQDIEAYFAHPLRIRKPGDKIGLLFANRLVDRYQPILMLEVYSQLKMSFPEIYIEMNSDGPLKEDCERYILKNAVRDVKFLDEIVDWNEMHKIYERNDILVLPASYSNGNGTIIEARASGMGIVISDGIHNIGPHSINGENCFICNDSKDAYINSISEYLNNPGLIETHGRLSKESVQYRRNKETAKLYYMKMESAIFNV